jgi:hypothetical protein
MINTFQIRLIINFDLQYSSEGFTTNHAEKTRNAILASEKPIHDIDIFHDVLTMIRPKFLKTNIVINIIKMATIITKRL